MDNQNTLRLVGLALRAGRLEVGEDAAADACQYKKARLLLLASDAAEVTEKLAEADGARYAGAAERLRRKAERLEERKEKAARAKQGGKKPPAKYRKK